MTERRDTAGRDGGARRWIAASAAAHVLALSVLVSLGTAPGGAGEPAAAVEVTLGPGWGEGGAASVPAPPAAASVPGAPGGNPAPAAAPTPSRDATSAAPPSLSAPPLPPVPGPAPAPSAPSPVPPPAGAALGGDPAGPGRPAGAAGLAPSSPATPSGPFAVAPTPGTGAGGAAPSGAGEGGGRGRFAGEGAPPPGRGGGAAGGSAEGSALALLRRRIEGLLAYPEEARLRSEEGEVVLRIRVDEAGGAREIRVWRSSGFRRLDEAARRGVLRAVPLPASPGWVEVPVRFSLR